MSAPEGESWSAWPAPAKLNLFLRITGRRPDGYHELQTVFQLLDWGDTVHVRIRKDGHIARVGGDAATAAECDDLVVKAANLLQTETKCRFGADLSVIKRTPMGGGFGGGSSDAATVLRVLDRLWGTRMPLDRLARLGLALGADVPVFVRGRSAWAEGIGEVLAPIDLPPSWYLLVDPGVSVPTRELFQAPELTRDAPPATIADFASGAGLGNAFEPVLRRLQPAVDRVLSELSRHGQARLTGSGSGCFLQFDSQAAALAVQETIPGHWRSWVAAGVTESPLLAALEAAVLA